MPPRTRTHHGPAHRRARSGGRRWIVSLLSLGISFVLLGAAAWMFTQSSTVREAEAWVAAKALARLMGTSAEPIGDGAFRFGTGFETRALKVTGECSVGPLLAIVLLVTGVLTAARGRVARSFFVAGAAAVVLISTANLARLVLIAWAFRTWGYAGYSFVHVYVGSVLIIAASGAALMLYLSLAGFRRDKRRRRPGSRPEGPAPAPA